MPYFGGSVCHIFCRNPLILTDFYAIQAPIVWHILGAYFLQIWGVGVVRIIFTGVFKVSWVEFQGVLPRCPCGYAFWALPRLLLDIEALVASLAWP